MQPLADPTRGYRLPLPGAKSAWLEWTDEVDGSLLVAVNLNPGSARPSQTRFLRLDTR